MAERETDQLGNLMTYTVFHVGAYLTLGAAVIAGGAIRNISHWSSGGLVFLRRDHGVHARMKIRGEERAAQAGYVLCWPSSRQNIDGEVLVCGCTPRRK